ncbi:MAG: methyltransferase domain-containing protein [Syntrophobacteraceae bacterium]|nr:protein N-lysine methyltransferase family protein [Desulfobacteraceae bacterium]
MSELERLLEQIGEKYEVEAVPLKIGDKMLKVLQFKDFEAYIEKFVESGNVEAMDLPFWAKVWDASLLLSYFLGRQPVAVGRRVLEIGAGIGIVGVYASLCGHRVTITDINEDALLFSRANVLLNEASNARVCRLDWNEPDPEGRYDWIVGSEVVYDRKSYPLLVRFLRESLAPDGIIFLAKNADLHTPAFFTELTKYFEFKQTVQTVQTGEDPQQICLYAIRHKNGATAAA